ncbi:MAG: hypothetical protein WC707_01820 [Candidatus Babeliaceae bacterium]|jgi:hypothetical protein
MKKINAIYCIIISICTIGASFSQKNPAPEVLVRDLHNRNCSVEQFVKEELRKDYNTALESLKKEFKITDNQIESVQRFKKYINANAIGQCAVKIGTSVREAMPQEVNFINNKISKVCSNFSFKQCLGVLFVPESQLRGKDIYVCTSSQWEYKQRRFELEKNIPGPVLLYLTASHQNLSAEAQAGSLNRQIGGHAKYGSAIEIELLVDLIQFINKNITEDKIHESDSFKALCDFYEVRADRVPAAQGFNLAHEIEAYLATRGEKCAARLEKVKEIGLLLRAEQQFINKKFGGAGTYEKYGDPAYEKAFIKWSEQNRK